ncbi:hypothetical protein BO82DRAFT_384043 [Aspergillus uvarum CBS 121591]|uniref:F-box domain-containing protein n=1 Tax=Aspergillus uvarum CBS 121591 TaxID=1448315 RepID=A0A319CAH6_9EURO|nr:hypothetical protein BO82DRAFT_384043 [Aspergillus uvarum CBS 121591]PYH81049.1 hypothetical protein BO82DRAFT_384043 [Aspergillus uvarum CBS 121591]
MPLEHQGSCGFLRCPAEILDLVFELLSTAELRALSLVNKDLCALVEPYVYSKIDWTWRENHAPPQSHHSARITNFQFQSLPAYRKEWVMFAAQGIPVPVAELAEFIAFVQRTGVPYCDVWTQGLSKGAPDAILALLLAQLSNLRCLSLDYIVCQQSRIIQMLLRSAICEPAMYRLPDFKHLLDVSFHSHNDYGAPSTVLRSRSQSPLGQALVLPFFYLPNIQHISAAVENTDTFAWSAACLPDPCQLTSIYLADIREANLGSLLSVTRNLQSASLDLASLGGGDQFYPAVKMEGSLRTMFEFEKLKRLQIPLAFLVGFAQDTTKRLQDVLPRNLEYLSLTDELAFQNNDGVSLIYEELDTNLGEWPPDLRHQLTELGTQAGVQLELVEWKRDW